MLEEFNTGESPTTEENIPIPEELLQQAQAQGYLLLDDLLAAVPELEEDMALLDEFFAYFIKQDIEIYSDPAEAEQDQEKNRTSAPNGSKSAKIDAENLADLSAIPADDTLSLYLREMVSVPLLEFKQEVALAKQLDEGRQAKEKLKQTRPDDTEEAEALKAIIEEGERARDHLIRANTRLVVSVAKKYVGQGVPFVDLIQEGNLGLMKATTKFDYRRGYKFSTYATWWIRQAVTRALASQGRTIRIPVHMNDRFRKLRKVSGRLEQIWGRKPTPEELAHEMELDPDKVRWMLRASQHSISLETPVGDEGDAELGHFIKDDESPPPPDTTHNHLLREELNTAIFSLPPREARILKLRFGLYDGQSYSLEEVGRKFGLTRERIRQLEKKALRQLRHPSRARPLKDYLS